MAHFVLRVGGGGDSANKKKFLQGFWKNKNNLSIHIKERNILQISEMENLYKDFSQNSNLWRKILQHPIPPTPFKNTVNMNRNNIQLTCTVGPTR